MGNHEMYTEGLFFGRKMAVRIKNWSKHQHFKDRTPPWIKLYRDILDDPDWHELSGDDAKMLVNLWLIASEDETRSGELPNARRLAFRLRIKESQVNQALSRLSHWLIQDDISMISSRHQVDAPEESRGETETRGETEETAPRKRSTPPSLIAKPDDVDGQTWADWLTLRKAKKAPVTETVVTGARDESSKAGMTLDAFLQVWCLRGSQGLQADWLRPEERRTASRVQPVSFSQQDKADKRAEWEAMTGRKWPDADAVPEFIDAEDIHPKRIAA